MEPAAINIGASIESMLTSVAKIVPKLAAFIVILVIGWIIAVLIQRLAMLVLHRLHFERVASRGMVGEGLRRGGYDASRLLAKLFFWAVILITLQLAFNIFGNNPITLMFRSIVAWLPKLAIAVIIVIVASAIAHALRGLVAAALAAVPYGRTVAAAVSVFIIGLGIIAALNQIGVATTVTEPVLITVLATVGAILAIGVGGGLIRPMQQRWERMLSRGERDAASIRTPAYQRGREDARRGAGTPTEPRPERHDTP
jgi:Conserved TM helix